MITLKTSSGEETFLLGKSLGQLLQPSMVLCLSGDLGAGKTQMTKGIATGLEIGDYITSPTYTLINEYNGRLPLYHFDVYRLENSDELNELGYQEYFYGEGVTVIEWADIISEAIPKDRLWMVIRKLEGDKRKIVLDGTGKAYLELLERLREMKDIRPMLDESCVKI